MTWARPLLLVHMTTSMLDTEHSPLTTWPEMLELEGVWDIGRFTRKLMHLRQYSKDGGSGRLPPIRKNDRGGLLWRWSLKVPTALSDRGYGHWQIP